MKQFSLEEYLKDPQREIITRDGRKVRRILCTDARSAYPVVALVEEYDSTNDQALSFTKDGRFLNIETDNATDLFFASKKKEGWVNIRKGDSDAFRYVAYACIFQSREEAEEAIAGDSDYITTLKIEWEE